MFVLGFFLFNGLGLNLLVGSQPESATGTPENVTVHLIDYKTAEVFWSTTWKNVERYDVTYNPTEDRVVSQAAGNSQSIVLRGLKPDTQYQVTVTAVIDGKNYRSRRLVFKTGNDPNEILNPVVPQPAPTKPTKVWQRKSFPVTPEVINPDPTAIGSKYTPPTSTTVRGVEIGLVLLALVVWIIAIALFFHRWGKIRMLLPYQPDYKTQQSLKVPGTGTTIVSGCSGNSASQGQQEGPGCVQHLRWSSRYFDEPSTAKKCSPSKLALRSRVSSAIFPSPPSYLYSRASVECNSPRMIRHAHSHSEFPTEVIPLCQVKQPQSERTENLISINVPVIASSVNEKIQTKKTTEGKMSEQKKMSDEKILKFQESEFNKKEVLLNSVKESDETTLSVRFPYSCCLRGESQKERREEKSPESEPLFFVESSDRSSGEPEKPRRYNRSSLKKQKVRLYDDRDLDNYKNVPIIECHEKNPAVQETEQADKSKKPKDVRTAEMKRKAFLRKVSLQDTYLNYNQDYWLDFKKSGRFHKSIDLGYFGNEDSANVKMETNRRTPEAQGRISIWTEPFTHQSNNDNQIQPLATARQSKLPSRSWVHERLKKSGSDPVIFKINKLSCRNCGLAEVEADKNDSSDLLPEVISECKMNEGKEKKSSWFFLSSKENIPLFSERNGLIETDFDVFNDMLGENRLLQKPPPEGGDDRYQVFCNGSTDSGASGKDFSIPIDFSDFYEIKLTNECETENEKKSATFNFEGGDAFFGRTLTSMSEDSDVFIKTDANDGTREFSYLICSSSSPPKSSPDF